MNEQLEGSRILARGGFLTIPNFFSPFDLDQLGNEANSARSEGKRNVWPVSTAAEDRGGDPDRAFTTVVGGKVQWTIFSAPSVVAQLTDVCGLPLEPAGGGSFSYYEQPGDFLGLHRDIVHCDLTVITCLYETDASPDAGALLVYSKFMKAPLAVARAAGKAAAVRTPVRRSESVALLGGFVPHEVTPMLPAQQRVVSIMCYRIGAR